MAAWFIRLRRLDGGEVVWQEWQDDRLPNVLGHVAWPTRFLPDGDYVQEWGLAGGAATKSVIVQIRNGCRNDYQLPEHKHLPD